MNKKVHMICNAHIDPIWQWDWAEGASAAVSTFQSAVNLAEDFDYIFCHNEVTLYKYIEEYAPALFEKIRELVKCGKWHIMGGWYLQPDCTMPSGESFVRQIMMGQKYFMEKFGVVPETAINFDPFGHTRGLVQIISKCGQNSYLFMRPESWRMDLPSSDFIWEGFDGSRISAFRSGSYSSAMGRSAEKIRDCADSDEDVVCVLWGVGNHGGGPSRKDLQDIEELIEDGKNNGIDYIHSTPEKFFDDINPKNVVKKSLYSCMPGCYISVNTVKQKHIQLENELYITEKICSAASLRGLMAYPETELYSAAEDLMNSEFHDVLPGSTIKAGEDNGLMYLSHGLLETGKLKTKAFFALLKNEKPSENGEYPIFVFNPHPYELDSIVECEFMLSDQNWSDTLHSSVSLYDRDGNEILCQMIKEESNLNLDWRKRIAFPARLVPMGISRYTVKIDFVPVEEKKNEDNFVFTSDDKYVEIDKKTGLLKSYRIGANEYIKDGFMPVMFGDNADPWGMSDEQLTHLGDNPEDFELMKKPHGVFGKLKSIEVIEDGELIKSIEAFFEKDNSKIRVEYKIYKTNCDIDVNVTVFWQDIDKLLRLRIPVCENGKLIGQTAFGTDTLFMNGKENVAHRFIAMQYESNCLAVINNCQYSSMFKNGSIYLSLLRGAGYCVHPIGDRQLVPSGRYIKRMDQCQHDFSFRITVCKAEELERKAMEFNQRAFAVNAYPVMSECVKTEKNKDIVIDNKNIVMSAFKKSVSGNGYIIRLFNNCESESDAKIRVFDSENILHFGKYEVKTVEYDGSLTELDKMYI